MAFQDLFAALLQPVQEQGRILLLLANPPHVVLHQKRDEHFRADKKGVVHLEPRRQVRVALAQNGARHQHPQTLTTDGAGADHAIANREEILEGEKPLDQGAIPDRCTLSARRTRPRISSVGRRATTVPRLPGNPLRLAKQPPPIAHPLFTLQAGPLSV